MLRQLQQTFGSICQLGIAHFSEGKLSRIERYLVNPQTRFEASHIALHGIEPATVAHAPAWDDLYVRCRAIFSSAGGNSLVR
jgi:DNA polymerase-3 subunit epsilon